jgi:hypothetical protein
MRCLNCHAVAMNTDTRCYSCGAPLSAASYRKSETAKPFFAVIFMVAGAAGYNAASPPEQAVRSNGGKINFQHAAGAGLVGGVCAMVGGLFDFLLNRRKS